MITLYVHTIGHHGAYVAISTTAEDAASRFSAEAAEDDGQEDGYGMALTMPRNAAVDAVRYLLGGYGDAHSRAVCARLGLSV